MELDLEYLIKKKICREFLLHFEWEFLKTLPYYYMKICILVWNIFEGDIALLDFRIFHEKKVITQKSSYILNGNYKSSFSKDQECGGGEGALFCFKKIFN